MTLDLGPALDEAADGSVLRIHVQPGAKRTEVAGLHGDALKVRIHAPPVEGRANEALIAFLASALRVERRAVTISAGERARKKRVRIAGLTPPEVAARLAEPAR